jgi:hypothetical protein
MFVIVPFLFFLFLAGATQGLGVVFSTYWRRKPFLKLLVAASLTEVVHLHCLFNHYDWVAVGLGSPAQQAFKWIAWSLAPILLVVIFNLIGAYFQKLDEEERQ